MGTHACILLASHVCTVAKSYKKTSYNSTIASHAYLVNDAVTHIVLQKRISVQPKGPHTSKIQGIRLWIKRLLNMCSIIIFYPFF